MNKKIVQKVNMFINVSDALNENPQAAAQAPVLLTLTSEFDLVLNDIFKSMGPLMLATTGIATDKQAAKLNLAVLLSAACGAVKAYATSKADNTLYAQAVYSRSAFLKMRDTELEELAKTLIDKVKALAADLASYGVTTTTTADLDNALTAFKSLNPKVRGKRVSNKTSRKLLADKVQAANDFLRFQMDNAVDMLKVSLPDFYDLYRNARRNYQVSIRHRPTKPEAATMEVRTTSPESLIERLRELTMAYAAEQEQEALVSENGVHA